jgi:hypothetical protein
MSWFWEAVQMQPARAPRKAAIGPCNDGLLAPVHHDRLGVVVPTGCGDTGDPLSARWLPGGAVPALAVERVPDLVLLHAWHWPVIERLPRVRCHVPTLAGTR